MSTSFTEDDLIARYFRPLATHPGARGLLDDAAVLAAAEGDLVITTDAIVEGIHFLPNDPPDTIARKALRVNLSDLAAKGAAPAGFVLTLAMRDVSDAFLSPFAAGLGADAAAFECPLLGGDTVSTTGPLTISITAFGRVPPGHAVHRAGARAGDHVFVSGTIGDAALGLDILTQRIAPGDCDCRDLVARYRVPQPRMRLATAVRDHAHAAMDVSDGLVGDLAKLCRASGVSAQIEAARVPLSAAARALIDAGAATLARALSGGDDYEILCAVPPDRVAAFREASSAAGQAVAELGRITSGSRPPIFAGVDGTALAFDAPSFAHFTS